jgi:hypothetical protein
VPDLSPAHAEWFLTQRGIKADTLRAFGVWSDGDAVVFPYAEGEKRRWGLDKEGPERGFSFTKGVKPSLYQPTVGDDLTGPVFLCEGETDTMRLWQEMRAAGSNLAVVGVSGSNGFTESAAASLANAESVYVVADNDKGYQAAQATDTYVVNVTTALGPAKVRRLALPDDVKDVCQFFEAYDLDGFREVVNAPPPPPRFTYRAVDLTAEPPPIRWLVDGTLAMGDTTLLAGEPGVGKSWLSMGLAVAVAEGHGEWLGDKVYPYSGRVLYVDEENPLDVVYDRMKRLGLTDKGAANIRFLHRCGIRLDRRPKDLLAEAVAFGPDLILLDSFSRLHSQDESSNGAMAGLFNDGINPLARVTGAATLLLHHVTKGDSNSSFQRVRGAGDITGSIDAGMDVRVAALGGFINLVYFKSRRRPAGDVVQARITDLEGGGVSVERTPTEVSF